MVFQKSDRLTRLPPYLFVEIDGLKKKVAARGVDIISLGIGDPDVPTPAFIVKEMLRSAALPERHHYPDTEGMPSFRKAAASWCKRRFHVDLDPETEILALIGSKEGIAHFPLAVLNEGDVALVPSPAYPVYSSGTLFAGGEPYVMPLLKKNGFLPDLDAVPETVARRAKLMFVNYPNNPTGAVADRSFYEKVVVFAKKYGIVVAHDAAYSEMGFDDYRPMSFLEIDGARDIGIEFHSLSKSFNMTGWRIGFAVGNAEMIAALKQVKSNIDSGAFNAVQDAAVAALESDQSSVDSMRKTYEERRDYLVSGLLDLGLEVERPKASFYVWCAVPKGYSSASFASLLLEKAGIVVTPGSGFGDPGEGFVRMALTVSVARLSEALERMRKLSF